MANRGLVVLAVLLAVSQAAWSQDDKAGKKKKKKDRADAAKVVKPKWEYKVVRADELVSGKPVERVVEDPKPAPVAEALNRLGADGWELVGVVPGPAPDGPRPRAGGTINSVAPDGTITTTSIQERVDALWKALSKGAEEIDLNAVGNADVKIRIERLRIPVPKDGIMRRQAFTTKVMKAQEERLSAARTTPAGADRTTYYFKRPAP